MNNKYTTYISRIYLENIKCFKGVNDFNLLDENGKIVQWTVILGNNNSGKTNILKSIADLEPRLLKFGEENKDEVEKNCAPLNLMRSVDYEKTNSLKDDKIERFIGCDILYKKRSTSKLHFTGSFSLFEKEKRRENSNRPHWGFKPFKMWTGGEYDILSNLQIYGYGVTRRTGNKGLVGKENNNNSSTLFNPEMSLINIEDWLLQLDYASKNNQKVATENLKKLKLLIKSGIFPDIFDFKFDSSENLKNNILFKTKSGWTKLEDLGYGYQTTLDGIMQKYVPGDYEFDVPKKLIELYDSKDYGIYKNKDGEVPVNFTATNHTTGGNSGSPALDARGNLVGLNFDRQWEGTMSDINYDPKLCRNIMVDTKYILFVVDKYANSKWLLDEMKIVK